MKSLNEKKTQLLLVLVCDRKNMKLPSSVLVMKAFIKHHSFLTTKNKQTT